MIEQFGWSLIRNLGENPIAKATLVFPFIGYAIIYSEYFGEFACTVFDRDECNSVAYLWRLHFLFFGLLSFSLGMLIYQIVCPSLQREYSSRRLYVEGNLTLATGSSLKMDFLRNRTIFGTQFNTTVVNLFVSAGFNDIVTINVDFDATRFDRIRTEYLEVVYDEFDLRYPNWRLSAFVLMSLGMVLLVVPTCYMIYRVIASVSLLA